MRVLVADDNPDSRQLIKDILSTLQLEVITAVDGPSALTTAQTQEPDLIILDINMPGMSGFDVCSILKSSEETDHIAIMMLTARNEVEFRVQGLDMGADDYLTKPFSPRELIARVETRLRVKMESDSLRQHQEVLRRTFERFVHASVVNEMLKDPTRVQLGGKLQEVTVLFADLEGFTALSERTDPPTLLGILNEYHNLIVSIILQYNGTVDKFLGDGVMALYNTPLPQEQHALFAVESAVMVRNALSNLHQQFPEDHRMDINFGIHTGMAVVGNVGTPQIMDYTAVGDTVNIASRLQGLSRHNQILISSATYEKVADYVVVAPIGPLHVKNRTEAIMTYEVMELKIE
ncbi:MAG: response regulator [Anaerolineae bacterium]|nr:response regulator [Anaerolineae bacterium]